MQTWAEMCRLWRIRHRFTQRRAAQEMGVALSTWSRWERGLTEPLDVNGRDAVQLMMSRDNDAAIAARLPAGIYVTENAVTFLGAPQ